MMIPCEMAACIDRHDPEPKGWRVYDAEGAASVATSAFCQHRFEDIRVVAIVVAKLELGEIERQIVFADVMECADDAALQETPETLDIVGMHFAAHVFVGLMVYRFVRKLAPHLRIARPFIGRDQADLIADGLSDKAVDCGNGSILNHFRNNIAFAGDRADDGGPADWATAFDLEALAQWSVGVLSADVGFVHFNLTHQLRKIPILHRGTDALRHLPSSPIIAALYLAVNLERANSFFTSGHQVDDPKPRAERIIRILEDRLCDDAEPIAVAIALNLGGGAGLLTCGRV